MVRVTDHADGLGGIFDRYGNHRRVKRGLRDPRGRARVLVPLVLDRDRIYAIGEQAERGLCGGVVHAVNIAPCSGHAAIAPFPDRGAAAKLAGSARWSCSMLRIVAPPPAHALALALALVAMVPAARLRGQQPASPSRSAYEELQTFSGVLNHIRVNYVDSVTYAQLVRAAIDGVLHSLDPHSRFESYA